MASVRILHASDLHICTVSNLTSPVDRITAGTFFDAVVHGILVSSYDVSVLQRFADFVYQQAARGLLHAVVLTGDIATTGEREDLSKALEFFKAKPDFRLSTQTTEQEPTLAGISIPLFLLPGNHDRYRTGPGYAPGGLGYGPGGRVFDDVFDDYWREPVMPILDLRNEVHDYGFHTKGSDSHTESSPNPSPQPSNPSTKVLDYAPIRNGGLAVAIISADFNLLTSDHCDTPFGWLAQGKAYEDILDLLEETTNTIVDSWGESNQLCVIWAVHFPPSFPHVSRLMRLIDSDKFIRSANRCRVNAVLAGHTHDPVRYRRPEMKFDVFCAGTVSQAFAPCSNHFRILEIKNDSGEISIASEDYLFRKFPRGIITNRSGFYRL